VGTAISPAARGVATSSSMGRRDAKPPSTECQNAARFRPASSKISLAAARGREVDQTELGVLDLATQARTRSGSSESASSGRGTRPWPGERPAAAFSSSAARRGSRTPRDPSSAGGPSRRGLQDLHEDLLELGMSFDLSDREMDAPWE
jgi:hypothetical protein